MQLPLILRPGRQEVDSDGLNGGVAQDVRQLHDAVACPVEGHGKGVAKTMGAHLKRFHPSIFAQSFHFRPDLMARQGLSVSGEEYSARGSFAFPCVFEGLPPQFAGNQGGTHLALQRDLCAAPICCLHDILDLCAHPMDKFHDLFFLQCVLRIQ